MKPNTKKKLKLLTFFFLLLLTFSGHDSLLKSKAQAARQRCCMWGRCLYSYSCRNKSSCRSNSDCGSLIRISTPTPRRSVPTATPTPRRSVATPTPRRRPTSTPRLCLSNGYYCRSNSQCCSRYCSGYRCRNRPTPTPTRRSIPTRAPIPRPTSTPTPTPSCRERWQSCTSSSQCCSPYYCLNNQCRYRPSDCNETCGSSGIICATGLQCIQLSGLLGSDKCRNPACPNETDCVCPPLIPTSTPTPRPPTSTPRPPTPTRRPTSIPINTPTPTTAVCNVTSVDASDSDFCDRITIDWSSLNCSEADGFYIRRTDGSWDTTTGQCTSSTLNSGLSCGQDYQYCVSCQKGVVTYGQRCDWGSTCPCLTNTPTPTNAPTPSNTPTPTVTPTNTPTPTITPTPSNTPTPTNTPTATPAEPWHPYCRYGY